MFYKVPMQGTSADYPKHFVVASVLVHPQLPRTHNLRIVASVRQDVQLQGWRHEHDPNVHTLIHVDSITSKVMFVPHFDKDKKTEQMCAIPMWRAR
jgi:hypothetical protein